MERLDTRTSPVAHRRRGAIPGTSSLTRRYAGDWRGVFTGRSTLLLQVAHPVVGAGVADHSEFFARGVRLAGAVSPGRLLYSPVAARAMRGAGRAPGG